mmetsp:Transcript_15903/g.24522  ORF Transcript_15903/g.24522 Transcript_15903/m.24522 type:complete len:80 (-) Transcript_15903:538-777(-)
MVLKQPQNAFRPNKVNLRRTPPNERDDFASEINSPEERELTSSARLKGLKRANTNWEEQKTTPQKVPTTRKSHNDASPY